MPRSPRFSLAGIVQRVRGALAALRQEPTDVPEMAPPPAPLTTTTRRIDRSVMNIALDSVIQKDAPAAEAIAAFDILQPAPGVGPARAEGELLAMDDFTGSAVNWAGLDALDEGLSFLGFPYLAQLTQRPEYRRPSEILAKEMTRRWIRIQASGDEDKTEVINKIEDELKRLRAQDLFQKAAEQDGFFGRSQIFIDVGQMDPGELAMPLHVSKRKIIRGSLRKLVVIEPIWTYPDAYNSNNPLADDFYKPTSWFVFSKRVHASRLLTFVSRDVPDILKPAYGFGGLSLSQMAKPYIDNWLRTRQSVSDAIHNFSVSVLKTNMAGVLNKGGALQMTLRARLFNQARDNQGLMMVDKDTEDFANVSTPLGGLDHLQAQSQEQMSAVTGIPLVILLGITPSGLNASTEGELASYYAWVEAQQRTLFGPPLKKLIDIIQLSLFGVIDPSISFMFEPLQVLSETEQATVEKTKVETDAAAINAGIIDPFEARVRLASDEDGPYASLDLTKPIAPPPGEQGGEGGDPFGGGEDDTDPTDPSGGGAPGGGDVPPKPTPGAFPPVAAAPNAAPAPPRVASDSHAEGTPMKAAGIVFRAADGSVLLLKRGPGGDHAGEWCFPGGKVEDGETRKQAARREAYEEIGDHPEDTLHEIESSLSADEGVDFTTFVQSVSKPFVPTLNHEHTGWAWARPDALPEPMHPGPLATLTGRSPSMAHDAEHWITVHPNGKHVPGEPMLIDGSPSAGFTIKGGAGGKLNGTQVKPNSMSNAREGTDGSERYRASANYANGLSDTAKSEQDHRDAATAHHEAKDLAKTDGDADRVNEHETKAAHHQAQADSMAAPAAPTPPTPPAEPPATPSPDPARGGKTKAASTPGVQPGAAAEKRFATATPDQVNEHFETAYGLKFANGSGAEKAYKALEKEHRSKYWTSTAQENAARQAQLNELDNQRRQSHAFRVSGHTQHDISDSASAAAKGQRKMLGHVDDALADLEARGFDVKAALTAGKVTLAAGSTGKALGHSWQGRDGAGFLAISHTKDKNAERYAQLAEARRLMGKPRWTIGAGTGDDRRCTIVHELAHALGMQRNINSPGKLGQTLVKMFPDHAERRAWIVNNISEYAATNIKETDAELCTMVTAPDYVPGTLPSELEDHVHALFKKKIS